MTRFTHRAAGLTLLALAALPLAGLATTAQAAERIHVGDLSQPDQLAAFDHSVDQAAADMCGSRFGTLAEQNAHRNCVAAVREEAVAQLSPAHRDQLAAASAAKIKVASAGAAH